jgi:hypothetical protein
MQYTRYPTLAARIRAWLAYRNHALLHRAVVAARGRA